MTSNATTREPQLPPSFERMLQPIPAHAVFQLEGWYVWCGSMVRTADGTCYLFFSRWPKHLGYQAWVTHSEVGVAIADNPLGPYRFHGVALSGAGGEAWDADVIHNPAILEVDGRYYLYYMGTRGPGGFWDYRNRQRIGVAIADHPLGPWKRFDRPLIDVSAGCWDSLMVSNPSCTVGPDGRVYMVYKGVGDGPMPKGGAVVAGVAIADHPAGPFRKHPTPIIVNPDNPWAVEDPFIWYDAPRFYCLIKDFQGYFAHSERSVLVLFESDDAIHWRPTAQPLAVRRRLVWEDGRVQDVAALERPYIWFDSGQPAVLFLACVPDPSHECSFNVHVPLRPQPR